MFKNAYIPYGGYYSTPFSKWQHSLQHKNAVELGGQTSKRWFEEKGFDKNMLNYLYLGITVGQKSFFLGGSYAAHEMGLRIPGQTVMHACATATTSVYNASLAVENGDWEITYCLLVDRCSNGPHTIWPNPKGPGGEVISENWNMDNMSYDPSTGKGMLFTAERVAKENGFTREEADELSLLRYQQYLNALENDREFQKKYMFSVKLESRKGTKIIEEDEGIIESTKEGLAKLRPMVEGGIHTFGSQTHPADANAGIIIANKEKSLELSENKNIPIQVITYACTRTEKKGYMPIASSNAAKIALNKTGLTVDDISTIKTHNPFIVNDLYLAKDLGIDKKDFNNYGSSMIYGHPQAPTLARILIEAIEETVLKGGGYALVTGCAAGDTGASIIVKVG